MRLVSRVFWAGAALLALALVGAGIYGVLLRGRLLDAVAATQRAQSAAGRQDLRAACEALPAAAAAWSGAAALTDPAAPVLRRLAWLPSVGPEVRALPDLVAFASAGSAAGRVGCDLASPALAASQNGERLALLGAALARQPDQIVALRGSLEQAQARWSVVAPQLDQLPHLASYRQPLEALGGRLGPAIAASTEAEELAPSLPWLLGLDAPRQYLVVLQNPFELRPTGGFMGLICQLEVRAAQPTVKACRPSEAFDLAAPDDVPIPGPYSRYLRFTSYYLRDANWSPDFPTAAQNLQRFWKLNGQSDVDGVVAADPYLLAPLLDATGPLTLDDGTRLESKTAVDALLERYYDRERFRDKAGLGELLPPLLRQVLSAPPARLPQVAGALQGALAERHLLLAVNQPEAAAALATRGWDSHLAALNTNTLRVVDSDMGRGGVNGFVDRLTEYELGVDQQGVPLTATLTLTYTNRYSAWAEAPTPFSVYGLCTDPKTALWERRKGCYGDYVRVYMPVGSDILDVSGFEESPGPEQELGRAVFGMYFRVNPGEQRVVRLSYRLPQLKAGELLIEKQPGTLAQPVKLTIAAPGQRAERFLAGATDIPVTYTVTAGELAVDGKDDPAAGGAFTAQGAWVSGLAAWQSGDQAGAIRGWQAAGVLDRALDHVVALTGAGDPAAAQLLANALLPVDTSGRSAFELATLAAAQGDASADALYRQAAEQGRANPLAQLLWAERQIAAGQASTLAQGFTAVSALRRWRAEADALEGAGDIARAATHVAVLRLVTPDDAALALRLADLQLRGKQQDAALAGYAALEARDDVWGKVAGARRAQLTNDPVRAHELYGAALPLATTFALAFRIGDGLRDLGDVPGAVEAYQKAAAIPPGSIWPLIAAGNLVRASDPAAARGYYERAQQLDRASGYPDFALGTLLLDGGDAAGARPLLEAAVAKTPNEPGFQAALERLGPAATP